jgi:hypothetical protein
MCTCVQDPSRQIKERIELCIDQIDAVHAAGTYPLSKMKIRLRYFQDFLQLRSGHETV